MIKLQIRKKTYRGIEGFTVYGKEGHRETRIFFEHYNQAQDYVTSVKAGYDPEITLKRIFNIH